MDTQIDYVVTCYNKAKYIRHVLESIINQQGEFVKRIIIVDDGSTDQSIEIINKFQQTCPIPMILIKQENAGPARAQNRGLKEVEAPYVKLLDGDDILAPYATAHLFMALEQHSDCILSFGAPTEQDTYDITTEGNVHLSISADASEMKPVEVIHDPLMESLRSARTTPSALLTKKEIIEKTGGSNPDVFIQDYSFELEAAYLGKFAKISTPVFYAPSELGERMSGNEAQTLHDVNMAIAYFVDKHPNLGERYKNYALYRCTSRAAKWAKRHRASQLSLRLTLMKFLAKLPLYTACFKKLSFSCKAFKHSHPIRVPK
ncbi:glycosyltransferase family A protein [Curvivirga aplysinae]|uniref:glycosyltransferase family A protein n=1 Tax=Curvivirga aplysinae TaxID=2529852 RepID=UPI001C3F6712|nr:glycosyltransferase family 2 protein [Curvivirga aplysinae]